MTKKQIREKIWRLMAERHVARFPGAFGRIPNFVGAEKCAAVLDQLPEWKSARALKCNPDSPQRQIRFKALKEGKLLYMAVPRLAEPKPFIELDPRKLKNRCYEASSIKGAFQFGKPVTIEDVQSVDLIVCGSVAVRKDGLRIGKGEGYSELEYAILAESGKVTSKTPIVTSIHPVQITKIKMRKEKQDFAVNFILTPEKLVVCSPKFPRPEGIYWELLTKEKIDSIPVLKISFARRKP